MAVSATQFLDCTETLTNDLVIAAAVDALEDFKNSHKPACPGVTNGTAAGTAFDGNTVCAATGLGYTTLITSTEAGKSDFIAISTVYDKDGNILSNDVQVE